MEESRLSDDQLNFFDYLGIVFKRRKFIVSFTIFVLVVGSLFQWSRGASFRAGVRIWASDPVVSLEFLKGSDVWGRVIDDYAPSSMSLAVEMDGNILLIEITANDREIARNAADSMVKKLIARHEALAASRLSRDREILEEQIKFFIEKQKQGLILEKIPLSTGEKAAPFVYVINDEPVLSSKTRPLETIKASLFALLLGLFFSSLVAFVLEYRDRHRADWENIKKKYSS